MLARGVVALALVAVVAGLGFFPRSVRSSPREPVLRAELLSAPGLGGAARPVAVATPEAPAGPQTVAAPPGGGEVLDVSEAGAAITSIEARPAEPGDGEDEETGRKDTESPLFYRHEIREGDSVLGIAERYSIGSRYIIWNNIDILPDSDLLTIGQILQIPVVEGIIHSVRLDETLSEIASLYEAEVDDIVAFAGNGLSNPDMLVEGSTILVPGGRVVQPAAAAIRPPPPAEPPVPARPSVAPGAVSISGFIWPVVGIITSYFGPWHPLGIDVSAPVGTPIAAAAGGQVVFVGGDACCSYGLHVEIKHDETYLSLYAHLDSFTVGLGDYVEQGEVIGYGGLTGRTTGPHLHFEIRRHSVHQDPLLYLP